VDAKNPNSQFYKALHIPTRIRPTARMPENWVSGPRRCGNSWLDRNGDGLERSNRLTDWTDGCVALTNEEIDEIYPLIKVGSPSKFGLNSVKPVR